MMLDGRNILIIFDMRHLVKDKLSMLQYANLEKKLTYYAETDILGGHKLHDLTFKKSV